MKTIWKILKTSASGVSGIDELLVGNELFPSAIRKASPKEALANSGQRDNHVGRAVEPAAADDNLASNHLRGHSVNRVARVS